MSEVNEKKAPSIKDYLNMPEPDKDFNEGVRESKTDPSSKIYTRKRPEAEEYFRVYDPSGVGDVESIPRRVLVNMIVKGRRTQFLCLGPKEFLNRVRSDFGKVKVVRLAMYETSAGRVDIWPVNEPKENQKGEVNAWNASANDILEKSLTKWVRIETNDHGYYDGYFCNEEKELSLAEEEKPEFKKDYDDVCIQAYQGFVLHPGNYDSDPHVKDFIGHKINTVVKNDKGKKIN